MRQITPKKMMAICDLSAVAVKDAISQLYDSNNKIPLEDVRFFLLTSEQAYDILETIRATELYNYNIHIAICSANVIKQDAWMLYCLDTQELITCDAI